MRAPPAARRSLLERLLALPDSTYGILAALLVAGLLLGGRQGYAAGLFSWPWGYVAHFLVYGALAALLWFASRGRWPIRVVLGVALVGMVDELHQLALIHRHGSIWDWTMDVAGAASAVAVLEIWRRAARRRARVWQARDRSGTERAR